MLPEPYNKYTPSIVPSKENLQGVQRAAFRSSASGSALKIPNASPYKLNAR